jgi:hypothetical protein
MENVVTDFLNVWSSILDHLYEDIFEKNDNFLIYIYMFSMLASLVVFYGGDIVLVSSMNHWEVENFGVLLPIL